MTTVTNGKATELITFTRGTLATVTDSDGKIKWAPHNLLLASEQFDASNWVKLGLASTPISANSILAPNGTQTADKIIESAANENHAIYQTFSGAVANGTYTIGVFLKAAERTTARLGSSDLVTGSTEVSVDLAAGTIGTPTATGNWQSPAASITAVGNGWFYVTVTGTKTSSGNGNATLSLSLGTGNYAGNGTSGIYAWGASLTRADLGGMQANTSAYPMYNPSTPKNLLGYSEDFSNAAWAKNAGSTVTANSVAAPNGSLTADTITFSSTANSRVEQSVSVVSGSTYTFSVWLKVASGTLAVRLAGIDTGSGTTVTVTDTWQRFSLTGVASSATRYPGIYEGAGASTVYAWGAQLSDSASLDAYSPVFGAAPSAAAYHGPRLDYDPVTLACKGLLVEEQRTNIVLRSQELDSGTWAAPAGVVNVTANSVTAPDGTLTADKLVPAAATNYMIKRQSVAPTAASHTFSVYGKLSDSGYHLELFTTTGLNVGAVFDLSTGAVLGSANCTTTVSSADANGWRRYSITLTANASTTYVDLRVTTASTINQSMTGDGTKGILVWGAQLEAGSFATSYIPTAAATVTRNADVASVGVSQFPYSDATGSLVVSGSSFGPANVYKALVVLRNTATTNNERNPDMSLGTGPGGVTGIARVDAFSGGVQQAGLGEFLTFVSGTTYKVGYGYAANDFVSVVNAGTPNTDTSGTVPTGVNTMELGNRNSISSTFLNGHIRQITYLPRRLTNAELQSRTA